MYNFGSKSSQNYASKLHFITLFDNSSGYKRTDMIYMS
jgi:hypothetical protein